MIKLKTTIYTAVRGQLSVKNIARNKHNYFRLANKNYYHKIVAGHYVDIHGIKRAQTRDHRITVFLTILDVLSVVIVVLAVLLQVSKGGK
jgi:hypothetical protein